MQRNSISKIASEKHDIESSLLLCASREAADLLLPLRCERANSENLTLVSSLLRLSFLPNERGARVRRNSFKVDWIKYMAIFGTESMSRTRVSRKIRKLFGKSLFYEKNIPVWFP
jgi:hypothetical protein